MIINAGWLLFKKDGPTKQQESLQLTYGTRAPLWAYVSDLTVFTEP